MEILSLDGNKVMFTGLSLKQCEAGVEWLMTQIVNWEHWPEIPTQLCLIAATPEQMQALDAVLSAAG